MNCRHCGRAHRAGARFCAGCGKPLAPRCPACGTESEADAQFCENCGAALVASPAPSAPETAEARKIVELWEAKGATLLAERALREGVRASHKHQDPLLPLEGHTWPAPARGRDDARPSNSVTSTVQPAVSRSSTGRTEEDSPAVRFANTATRAAERFQRGWSERDCEGLVASFAPAFRMDDRRALVGFSLSGEDFLANLRMMFEMPASGWHSQLRATRGERLALLHSLLTGKMGTESVVEFESVFVRLTLHRDDRVVGVEIFEVEDLEDAQARFRELGTAPTSGHPS
jgi:hypothetical protein